MIDVSREFYVCRVANDARQSERISHAASGDAEVAIAGG
jgi:hypothetical protein